MSPEPPTDFQWLEPWQRLEVESKVFVRELLKEVPPGHMLQGHKAVAVAQRMDCDDVLFVTSNTSAPLAVVHLTWSGKVEPSPDWPATIAYTSWDDWAERCMLPDHRERCQSS